MRIIVLALGLLISIFVKAEKLPPIVKKLSEARGNVITFSHIREAFYRIPDLPESYAKQFQYILKTPKGLFLCTSGSGRIYKMIAEHDSLQLVRMDKTYFGGYNYESLFFNVDTTIFSYGGYGFWHINGDLRAFVPEIGEWDVKPTNIYIPRMIEFDKPDNFHYLDEKNRTLYVSGPKWAQDPIRGHNSIKNPLYGNLYKLHIDSAHWEELGSISDPWYRYVAMTPYGLLAGKEKDYQILDVVNNRILKISGATRQKLLLTPSTTENTQKIKLSYFINNFVYVGDMDNWIDSIYLDPKDLVDTGLKLYSPKKRYLTTLIYLSGGLLLLVILGFVYVKIRRRKAKNHTSVNSLQPEHKENDITKMESSIITDLLDEPEKELLKFILEQSRKGKLTSIPQINEVLGLTKRPVEMQKRIRSECIGSINEKSRYLYNNPEPILLRSRSDVDKRMLEYFIQPDRFEEAVALLHSKNGKQE